MKVVEAFSDHIIVGFDHDHKSPTAPSTFMHQGVEFRRWQNIEFGTLYEHLKEEYMGLNLYALPEYHNKGRVAK